jgi:hypothetical protein
MSVRNFQETELKFLACASETSKDGKLMLDAFNII